MPWDEEVLSRLVGSIYDVVDDPDGWGEVLERMSDALEADRAHMFVLGDRDALVEVRHSNLDAGDIDLYHRDFQATDPRFFAAEARRSEVLTCSEWLGQERFTRTAVYNDYLKKLDIGHSMFVNLQVDSATLAPQAFFRDSGRRHFDDDDVRNWNLILPHVRRVMILRRTLIAARDKCGVLQRALDMFPMPVAVLDAAARVLCMSHGAELLVRETPRLRLKDERLQASVPRDASALQAAIQACLGLADPVVRTRDASALPPVVEIERAERKPLALILLPLRPRHSMRQAGDSRARVLVGFHDPDTVVRLEPALVAEIHHLTPTEAQLAVALSEGASLAQFAARRGCSEQTARTHLKHVLEKTGCRRQSDLVRLMLSTTAMHLAARP